MGKAVIVFVFPEVIRDNEWEVLLLFKFVNKVIDVPFESLGIESSIGFDIPN